MLRLFTIPLLLTALAGAMLFWSAGASTTPAGFSFVNRGENKCLDPNGMSWMQDIRLAYALWEGLYTLDPVTLKPIPGCADRIDVDPETHTVWTFHIRPDARWSNGDPVTADDFIFSWRRFLETPGDYTYLHYYIKNAKEYATSFDAYVQAKRNGDSSTRPSVPFSAVGEEKLDDHTLRVTLRTPVPFFPSLCAFPPFFPLDERTMKDFRQEDPITGVVTYDQKFTRPPNLVTNGPYRMTEWSFKRRVRLTASDYYWDRAHVLTKVIDEIYAEDAMAAYRTYEEGDADWLADVDPNIAAPLLKQHRKDLYVFPAFGTYYYSINCLPKLSDGRANPMTDIRVRQAMAMAIDKRPIVDNVGRLNQPIANTYVPPGVFDNYPSPTGLQFNIAAARKLLADAGYPDGKGFPHLGILYNTEANHGDVAQIIRRQWKDNLGIVTDLEGVEIKVFGERLRTQQYDIARASWYGDYFDPSTFTDKYISDSEGDDAKWKNADYDRLCAAAQVESDPIKRYHMLAEAEGILLNEAAIIPLYTYVNAYMFRANVTGIPLDSQAMLMFKNIAVRH